jgi:hypothetical protein
MRRSSASQGVKSKRVVRTYGRWTLLGLLSPLLTAFMVSRGVWGSREGETLRAVEEDAQRMANAGFRVVSAEKYAVPFFGVAYVKVVYERTDGA